MPATPEHSGRARDGGDPPPRRLTAEGLFFPLAVVYGSLAVPLSVQGMLGPGPPLLPGFASVQAHAHELLFGYALAVVAGFLVTRASRLRLMVLAAVWLMARAGFLTAPSALPAMVFNVGFVALLGAWTVPPFLKGAKKLRNKAIAPILVLLCLLATAFHAAGLATDPWIRILVLQESVLLLALLMLFMGGRIIAPAAAGAIERAGGHLDARVQPRIEAALLVAVPLGMLAVAIPRGRVLAGVLLLVAAGLAALRLLRWRLWKCRARPDLWALGLGYLWLACGLALVGLAWLLAPSFASTATHAITLGALGTLTTGVMARVRLTRRKRDPARAWTPPLTALILAAATITRLAGGSSVLALGTAALLWSAALLFLLVLLVRVPAR